MNPEYPDSEGCYMARLERTMRDISDKYHEFLWQYTGQGKSPHVVQAAVTYIETRATLAECADDYNAAYVTISAAVNAMIDDGVVTLEEVRENNVDNGLQVFGEKRHEGNESVNLHE